MNHLVIGLGEVGRAIQKILDCDATDANGSRIGINKVTLLEQYDILDICFGFGPDFISEVNRYRELYKPRHLVIHSTVPLGTCESLSAHHSPIRGKHPDLYESVLKFEKFLAGPFAFVLKPEYENYGFKIIANSNSRNTEALKLWETTQLAVSVMLEKEMYNYCKKNSLSFDIVYTKSFETYNAGYEAMGLGHFKAPIIKHMDGKIGGHCVIPNCHLLDSPTAKRILEEDSKL